MDKLYLQTENLYLYYQIVYLISNISKTVPESSRDEEIGRMKEAVFFKYLFGEFVDI